MAKTIADQFFTLLKEAERPLVLLPREPSIDHLATAAAFFQLCREMGKPADGYAEGFHPPSLPAFLPGLESLSGTLPSLAALHISIPTHQVPLQDLTYQREEKSLRIQVTPKTGAWKPEEILVEMSACRYDLLVCIGAADVGSLGAFGAEHRPLFEQLPSIVLDIDLANERYGTLNIVDASAASLTHALYRLITAAQRPVDAILATTLLAGMIHRTRRFTADRLAPDALAAAGELVAHGARRQDILTELYRTRSVNTLRLWGRAMARLKADAERSLVWTVLTGQDFALAGTTDGHAQEVLDELVSSSPDAALAVLLCEKEHDHVDVFLASKSEHALQLLQPLGATGDASRATCRIPGKLPDIEAQIIAHLRQALPIQT